MNIQEKNGKQLPSRERIVGRWVLRYRQDAGFIHGRFFLEVMYQLALCLIAWAALSGHGLLAGLVIGWLSLTMATLMVECDDKTVWLGACCLMALIFLVGAAIMPQGVGVSSVLCAVGGLWVMDTLQICSAVERCRVSRSLSHDKSDNAWLIFKHRVLLMTPVWLVFRVVCGVIALWGVIDPINAYQVFAEWQLFWGGALFVTHECMLPWARVLEFTTSQGVLVPNVFTRFPQLLPPQKSAQNEDECGCSAEGVKDSKYVEGRLQGGQYERLLKAELLVCTYRMSMNAVSSSDLHGNSGDASEALDQNESEKRETKSDECNRIIWIQEHFWQRSKFIS